MSNTKHFADLMKVCSILPALLVMPAMGATYSAPVEIESGKTFKVATGAEETYTGAVTGEGKFQVLPGKVDGVYNDTTVVLNGDVTGFTGIFTGTQYGVTGRPNAVPKFVFKNYDSDYGFNLDGNAYFYFDGNETVKIASTTGANQASVFLNGNALSQDSVVNKVTNIYLADADNDIELKGYKSLSKAEIFVIDGGQEINGNLDVDIEDSTIGTVYAMSNNTTMVGDVDIEIDNATLGKVVGQVGGSNGTNSVLTGNINIDVEDSEIGEILGQQFVATGTTKSGINGDINIDVENSTVNLISGVSFNAGDYQNWNANMYDVAENINIRVKDSVVKEELLATGSYPSAGNVKIDVLGDTVIGYTDATAQEVSAGKDGWIIAGAQRPGAHIDSAEINLNTAGTIKIAGAINAGGREREPEKTSDIDSTGRTTLNMFGGGDIFVGGDVRAYHVAGDATFNMDDVSVDIAGTLKEFKEINIGAGTILKVNNLELAENSVMNITLTDSSNYGQLAVNGTVTGADNSTLNILVSTIGEYKDVLSGIKFTDFENVSAGTVFDVDLNGADVVVNAKSTEKLVAETGMSTGVASAVSSLVASKDAKLQQISLIAQDALSSGDIAVIEKELAKVGPEEKPVSHSVASSVQGQVLTVASGRMASVGGASAGRAGGEVTGAGVWAQGLFNKSKLNGQFHGYTRGLALGADTIIDDVYTIGVGYAYNNTDMHAAGRDTGVESNSVFVYGQYKPAEWFVNATLNYTTSEYADSANVFGIALDNEYDADAFGMQTMFGYDFENGVTPMAGMRYLHVSQDAHRDALGRTIKEMDTNFLSVVTGVNYAFEIENDWAVALRPELHAAMTYDVVSEGSTATIVVPGSAAYYVDIENLSRFGGEFGIGLTAEYRGLEVSLNYELDLHEDYTSQTGLLKFRYDF
ncbi:MAG: autotransporter outer membrane beta-barrel domain-containing protein [Alphaproteobacteria bacterium]|nr:autotransporter outer membrane beta-barrel domain-containing protein [Alphaproteobacteria bacterium]